MSSRMYTVSAAGITVAGATTLVFINPGATCSIEILRAWIGQSANNSSAQQRVQLVGQVTGFPTLTGVTPAKVSRGDPISAIVSGGAGAAGTSGINASAEGAGAKSVILNDAFNVLNGWLYVPTPEERVIFPASAAEGFGLYLPAIPATLANWAFGVTFREL